MLDVIYCGFTDIWTGYTHKSSFLNRLLNICNYIMIGIKLVWISHPYYVVNPSMDFGLSRQDQRTQFSYLGFICTFSLLHYYVFMVMLIILLYICLQHLWCGQAQSWRTWRLISSSRFSCPSHPSQCWLSVSHVYGVSVTRYVAHLIIFWISWEHEIKTSAYNCEGMCTFISHYMISTNDIWN